jgi:hypothetical protein
MGTTAQRTIRIREKTFNNIRKMADSMRGMPLVEVLDVLVEGWSKLTPEQRAEIVARPTK